MCTHVCAHCIHMCVPMCTLTCSHMHMYMHTCSCGLGTQDFTSPFMEAVDMVLTSP